MGGLAMPTCSRRMATKSRPSLMQASEGWLASRSSFGGGSGPPSRFAQRRATSACNHERRLVDQNGESWNRFNDWLVRIDALRLAA
jgi:hypothetical protein